MRPSNSSRNMAPFKDFESVAATPQLLATRPHGGYVLKRSGNRTTDVAWHGSHVCLAGVTP
jgi:hypothetical protein